MTTPFDLPGIRLGGIDHDTVTSVITKCRTVEYGKGIDPNPYARIQPEWTRQHYAFRELVEIHRKMQALFEPRFITPPETASLIGAIITATGAKNILEIGMCTGFGTLHILQAIVGKQGHKVTSVDSRPAHDREFFSQDWLKPYFRFVEGWTPDILNSLKGEIFDVVFVDSDHSVEHCEKELQALWPITRKGSIILFHDCPERQAPEYQENQQSVIFKWLHEKVAQGLLRGTCLPTCEQMDCLAMWGWNYDPRCNPGLGIFVRAQ